jgi:hypothetical protein
MMSGDVLDRILKAGCAISLALTATVGWSQSLPIPAVPNRNALVNGDPTKISNVQALRPDRDTPQSFTIYHHGLDFSTCVVARSQEKAKAILATTPHSAGENGEFDRMPMQFGGCNGSYMIGIATLARGALSEATYKSIVTPSFDESKITATAKDSDAFLESELKHNKLREKADQAMIDATNCMAVVQPAMVHKVLYTPHGSVEEATAMDALFAAAPTCAGATRPKTLSRSFLRGFLGDSMYRLSTSEWRAKFVPASAR